MKDRIFKFIKDNRNICIISLLVLAILIISIILILCRGDRGNSTYNLNNLGFSVKKDGWVYYLGLKDNTSDGIYRIKENGDKGEKISSDYGIYLNVSGNYIYYLDISEDEYNIVKMKTNDTNKEVVINDVDGQRITVADNWIYYFKDSNFYRAKTNGDSKQILLKKAISNYQIVGKNIYYSYSDGEKSVIAKMKINGKNIVKIDSDASKEFYINNGRIYFIYQKYDEDKFENSYYLYSMKLNGNDKKEIVKLEGFVKTGSINFDNNRIYYIKAEEDIYSIYSMKLDGKDEIKITEIKEINIIMNVHGKWMYYTDEKDNGDSQMFKVRTNGNDKKELSN